LYCVPLIALHRIISIPLVQFHSFAFLNCTKSIPFIALIRFHSLHWFHSSINFIHFIAFHLLHLISFHVLQQFDSLFFIEPLSLNSMHRITYIQFIAFIKAISSYQFHSAPFIATYSINSIPFDYYLLPFSIPPLQTAGGVLTKLIPRGIAIFTKKSRVIYTYAKVVDGEEDHTLPPLHLWLFGDCSL